MRNMFGSREFNELVIALDAYRLPNSPGPQLQRRSERPLWGLQEASGAEPRLAPESIRPRDSRQLRPQDMADTSTD